MLVGSISLITLATVLAAPPQVTHEQVSNAVSRLKSYFYRNQDAKNGHWEADFAGTVHAGGETALAVLSLLVAGDSPQNPPLAKAIDWLGAVDMKSTYAVALRSHVWSKLSDNYLALLRKDVEWLLAANAHHGLGLFDYQNHSTRRIDHSVTQFGTLGLWEAAKRGVQISPHIWQRLRDHFLRSQHANGGWDYSNTAAAYGSMTAAGLTVLFVCRSELEESEKATVATNNAINRGMTWLDRRFDGPSNVPGKGWPYYYLVSIERVALAGGIRLLNGQDWYVEGARFMIDNQVTDAHRADFGRVGISGWQSAMALMFLARGLDITCISKLAVPDTNWNHDPTDVSRLTTRISRAIERRVNWQVISIDSPPESWLDAPVLYMRSPQAVTLSPSRLNNLKRYLELGGMLVATPVRVAPTFGSSVRQMSQLLFPRFSLRAMERDHMLFRSLHHLDASTSKQFYGLSNGVRELIILSEQDWTGSKRLKANESTDEPGRIATNLFSYVTNRGQGGRRLESAYEHRADHEVAREITIARGRYDGEWLPEPAGWEQVANRLFNKSRIDLRVIDVELIAAAYDLGGPTLLHLTGIKAVSLEPSELAAIERFGRRGGTVLVETVAGRGDFARSVEQQLAERLRTAAVPLDPNSKFLSGGGIDGTYDVRRVKYRRLTAAKISPQRRPRLAAFHFDGQPAIIVSREDLTLGMLGLRHEHVLGYEVDSARNLATNLAICSAGTGSRNGQPERRP